MMLGWTLVLACTLTACLGQERRAMGFMGVRGKKDGGDGGAVDVEESSVTSGGAEFAGSPLDGDDHHSMTMMMSPHHPPFLLFDRPSSLMDKRGPSMMGFQGVRGKKDDDSGSPSSMFIESDGSLMAVSPYSGYEEWKRAPAMGFQGVRGKKAPMGFTGVRGKKENYGWLEEDKRAPAAGFFGVRGKKGPSSSGFFGMRGKKGPSSSSFFGMRGKRGKNEEPEDIETLLQALKDSPMRQDFNGLMESRVRRFASPQDSQSTSEVNMMQ